MTPSEKTNPLALRGMVTSPHYLASGAGLAVLRKGGNAVEALIAASAVLCVVYPHMCSLGGDSFWLIYSASDGRLRALDASGRAAGAASVERYFALGIRDRIPSHGYLAANTVPGAVSGWKEAHDYAKAAMGAGLSWSGLFEEAFELSLRGVPVSTSLAKWLEKDVGRGTPGLERYPGFSRLFLPEGRALASGDVFWQKDLAGTFERLMRGGAEEFYEGETARRIVDDVQAHGGLLCMDDFKNHSATWKEPLKVRYRGYEACNVPPCSQGVASLEILNILENFDVAALKADPASYVHLLTEATKLAFLDRDAYVSDPEFADIPLEWMLSKEHGREQAASIDMGRARFPASPVRPDGGTVWLGAVDAKGNAVSLIQSIFHDFGSAIVPEGTGVILQNRGSYFSLDGKDVNCLLPGKRTLHTLNPAMLLKDARPSLVFGTMGGEGQPQTQAAMVTRMVDFCLSPQEAVDGPRWLWGRTWGDADKTLKLESRFPEGTCRRLRALGHPVVPVAPYADVMGHAGAVKIFENGMLQGASDSRGDGSVSCW